MMMMMMMIRGFFYENALYKFTFDIDIDIDSQINGRRRLDT